MPKDSSKVKVYSALEVANICGVVNQTVINWIKKGYLSAFSTPGSQYRVYQDDLIAFMNSRNMRVPFQLLEENEKNKSRFFTILVVESEIGLNNVMANYLTNEFEGHNVVQVFDSFEAGVFLAAKKADIVLFDFSIPGMNGFDLCKKIFNNEDFGKPKIVAITASRDDEADEKIRALGVKHLLKKPLNLTDLHKVFATLLK
ncbi:MAG: response regulator [Treponemataceae bacterium]